MKLLAAGAQRLSGANRKTNTDTYTETVPGRQRETE